MKKVIAFILAALMLLSMASCGNKAEPTPAEPTAPPAEATPEPTAEPTPIPEPEWEPGFARASYSEVFYQYLERGAELNILGEFKDYFIIEGEELYLIIEKRFARAEWEDAFEEWTGYAKYGAKLFENVYMDGEPAESLNQNDEVQVVDGKGDWLLVVRNGQEYYVNASEISATRIAAYYGGGGGGGNGGGGGGGAPTDGTGFDFSGLSYTANSGNAKLLTAYFGPEMETEEEEEKVFPCKGVVLADQIEAYIAVALRDGELKITAVEDETASVWFADEFFGTLPRWLLRMEGDEEYESWTGYVKYQAAVYEEYQMRNVLEKPNLNTEVSVIDELDGICYVVQLEDGRIGYMSLDGVSATKIVIYNGGGANGGGGGGQVDVWTPPAL